MVISVNACDIWKASECQGQPSKTEEELMKSDDYTKEELYAYCDKGKAYVDCVNNKLKCCDLKLELRGSLKAHEKQLTKVAWKLGPYCAGLGATNVIRYKCRTTTRASTTTEAKSTKSTLAPCQIEKAGEECTHYLDGRVIFEESWNVYDKMEWCRDAIDYVNCATQFLINCNISNLKEDADQLQSFIDFVTKSANVHCPGGIKGCEDNINDVRCKLGIRYFIGEYNLSDCQTVSGNRLLIMFFPGPGFKILNTEEELARLLCLNCKKIQINGKSICIRQPKSV
ncbi:hypothetical protein BpHYR1_010128 [Brachionus plicatilis]|uniref:Uncharacterized protein n=1 Tax=Brachionus plicatilis TaxID=10195 RepID=A0A3M7R908_BRAPC|nr:hypothetical protein BpHYR1_010128 [Brachionus plicatilis]